MFIYLVSYLFSVITKSSLIYRRVSLSFYVKVNGEGSQAARKNDKETKGLQKDEIDNTNPGADKVLFKYDPPRFYGVPM